MAARNRLPNPAQQRLVANAVHTGVVAAVGEDLAPHSCALYAMVGEAICRDFLPGGGYASQAGTLKIRLEGDDDLWWSQVAGNPETAGLEFHAIIMAQRAGRLELVDLASRHYEELARRTGVSRSLTPHPAPLWSWTDELPATFRFQVHLETTAIMRRAFLVGPERSAFERAYLVARKYARQHC